MVRVGVGILQNRLEDVLGEADGLDSALLRDRFSIRGNAHAVLHSITEHSVDVDNHVSIVVRALTVIQDKVLVIGVNREVCNKVGGGGRHLIYIGALPLGGSLPCCNRLNLGQRGGVVVVVGGSIVGGGGINVFGGGIGVVRVTLFAINLFVVVDFVL